MDIRQRIFDKRGRLKGILYADMYWQPGVNINGTSNSRYIVGIGYAMQHPVDKMDKQFAINVSKERSWKWIVRNKDYLDIPYSIYHDLYKFTQRCEKYYKVNDDDIVFADWITDFIGEYLIANVLDWRISNCKCTGIIIR